MAAVCKECGSTTIVWPDYNNEDRTLTNPYCLVCAYKELRVAARALLTDYSFAYPYVVREFPDSKPFDDREAVKQLRKALREEEP